MPRDTPAPPPPPKPKPPLLAPAIGTSGTASTDVEGGFLGSLSSGFRDAYAIGAPSPEQAAQTAQEKLDAPAVRELNKALRAAGADPIPTNPEDQIRAFLKAAGADTENAELQATIVNLAPYWAGYTDGQKQMFIASQVEAHPLPQAPGVADYNQAVSEYGFGTGFSDYTQSTVLGQLTGAPGGEAARQALEKISTEGYIINPENGALLFKNGVIFDPGTGNLVFPQGDPDVVGSGSWLHSVTKWSPEKVLEWRKTLGEQGYLPAADALNKSGDADSTFLTAISAYQNARYANYGTPIAKTSVDLSKYGPEGNVIFDLSKVRGTISSQVRSQYRTTFGQDPSSGELKSWTDFVVRTGMSLQRQGLDASQATSEALNTFGNRAESSPQANFIQDRADENTALADALSSAVSATASVTR